MNDELKAPFPYFGGKSLIVPTVWELFGGIQNYVEPFAGSLAVLLGRPAPVRGPETVNDYSCFVVNAWRAMQADPEGLAKLCVGPSAEVDEEAQHYALVSGEMALRDKLGDPETYDLKRAAWWIKGACEWIGSGWCSREGPWHWSREHGWAKSSGGVNRQLPHLGNAGTGVNRQLLESSPPGQFEARQEWLTQWFSALSDRLCHTRIACGDWSRVCGESVTTKHAGVTGVFLDPPYDSTEYVYGKGTTSISEQVRQWCIGNTGKPKLKIILCGRGTEHDDLLIFGWQRVEWKTRGGYSAGKDRSKTEVLWHNITKNL